MAINVNTLAPASIKAKNVATEQYVDSVATSINSSMQNLASTVEARDGLVTTFYQTTAPTSGMEYGDYWLDTDAVNYPVYRFQGTNGYNTGTLSWAVSSSTTATAIQVGYQAQIAAGTAQSTANSKNRTFYQATAPSASAIGDLWIDTDDGNKLYRWNGSSWTVASADVSGSIASNNDIFAQKLGYADYAAMVNAASSGQTIINGGYLRTELIQANAITANKINTAGLIAENISASEIIGKAITGSIITGSVIKASYLDLDGELKVLTNYHITPAMYNANPNLYTDAVYVSANNEYRIPSMSTVKELTATKKLDANGSKLDGVIKSYKVGNTGNTLKVVKSSGFYITVSSSILIGEIVGIGTSTPNYWVYPWTSPILELYIGESKICEFYFKVQERHEYAGDDIGSGNDWYTIWGFIDGIEKFTHSDLYSYGFYNPDNIVNPNFNISFTHNGYNFRLVCTNFNSMKVYMEAGEYLINSSFISTASLLSLKCKKSEPQIYTGFGGGVRNTGYINAYLSPAIYVNNMI